MLATKEIMLLNLIFSSSLGFVALLLFAAAMRRSALPGRPRLFLFVRKDGVLFRKVPIRRGHYRIGRGLQCDVLLDGMGIPIVAGEIRSTDGVIFKNVSESPATRNSVPAGLEFEVLPGDEIGLFNYSMKLETD
jgi:hypothetical protein